MKRWAIVCGGLLGAIGGYALNASAGLKSSLPLVFETIGGELYASGGLGTVRNSSNSSQYHGCTVYSDSLGTLVNCASQSGGTSRSCWTDDPVMVATATALNGDSWLSYSAGSVDGDCTSVNFENGSNLQPK
jgi:hypothetical protein